MANEKGSTAAAKPAPRIWTEEEKDVVWEQACQAKANNEPLTGAFRKAAKLLPHRSEAAIGMLYYNVLRKEREEPEKKPAPQPEFKVDKRLLEAFQGLPEYMQELNRKIISLEERIQNPDPDAIVRALLRLAQRESERDRYKGELEELQAKLQELQEENGQLHASLEKLNQAYHDAQGIYDMFTNMASISQIMSLGDFKQQMKTTLDKWGNVLEITFARKVEN